MLKELFFILIFLALFIDTSSASTQELKIVNISPAGDDVSSLGQISFTFNKDMVSLGKMSREAEEIPISITPPVECKWRWISKKALACQLSDENKLKKATKYQINVGKELKAEDGAALLEEQNYSFITQRPKLLHYVYLKEWHTPTLPSIRVTFNQKVSQESVEKHLYFLSNGTRYEAKILKSQQNFFTVSPLKEFKANSDVSLHIEPGIRSPNGDQKSIQDEKIISFATYDSARLINVSCYTPSDRRKEDGSIEAVIAKMNASKKNVKCSPDRSIYLEFNAPVLTKDLYKNIVVTNSSGERAELLENNSYYDPNSHHRLHDRSKVYRVRLPIKLQAQAHYFVKILQDGTLPIPHSELQKDMLRLDKINDTTHQDSTIERIEKVEVEKEKPNIFIRIWDWIKSLFGFVIREEKIYEDQIFYKKHEAIKSTHETSLNFEEFDQQGKKTENALKDLFSRPLNKSYSFVVETGNFYPSFHLKYRDVVLEKDMNTDNTIEAVNFDSIKLQYRALATNGLSDVKYHDISPSMAHNQYKNISLGIRDVLEGESGIVSGKILTYPIVCEGDACGDFTTQITPYNILAKIGHFNSVIWVANLSNGKSVKDAKVSLYLGADIMNLEEKIDSAKTDENGLAILKGHSKFDPKGLVSYSRWSRSKQRLFVKVEKDKEIAILPATHDFEVSASRVSGYQVGVRNFNDNGHIKAWGITSQAIYKQGDKVSYKIYVRNNENKKLSLAQRGKYSLKVSDPLGKTIYERNDITLSDFSTFDGSFNIANSAASGWYKLSLKSDFTNYFWYPVKFLVSDFTPAPFQVSNNLNGDRFYQGDTVKVDSFAKLHAGGPYSDSPARTIATVEEVGFSSEHPLAAGFKFDSYKNYSRKDVIFSQHDKVDAKGELHNSFVVDKNDIYYGKLLVESSVFDDRGKNISTTSKANYFAVNRFIGLKSPKWLYNSNKDVDIKYIVVDENGYLVSGSKAEVAVQYGKNEMVKAKSSGNSFINRYEKVWTDIVTCKGVSKKEKALSCKFKPEKSGQYRLTAKVKDNDGNDHQTKLDLWVSGNDWVNWNQKNDNSLTVIPQSQDYLVGQKAKFMIQNPYPDSQALVTIERYGIIKQWVQELNGNMPIIEFDVEPDFLPGFYLSVTVMSKRSKKDFSDEGLDLGKPSFKMGYVKINVNDPYKKILVDIKPDKEIYKPKQTVFVDLKASSKTKNPGKMELTAVVIDKAVFDMIQGGSTYYDVHKGFNNLGHLDIANFNLIQKLIGRQKIEKKGANPGGGGVNRAFASGFEKNDANHRKDFAYVAYFNPSIITDPEGNAKFDFTLPSNLTSWKILILATNEGDLLGLSQKDIKSILPLEINTVMPNQIREGDNFDAGFVILNREKTIQEVTLEIDADIINEDNSKQSLPKVVKRITVEPFKRQKVFIPINTKKGGKIIFSAKATTPKALDSLSHEIKILRNRSLEVAANYSSTTKDKVTELIKLPNNIYDDIGDVNITLAPTIIGHIDGSFKYMNKYPYQCWEQRLSKAVMASHYQNLQSYISKNLDWETSKNLPQHTLDQAYRFQAPNGGLSYFRNENNFVSPYLSAYTSLAFSWLTQAGYEVDKAVEEKLDQYLLDKILYHQIDPDYYTRSMDHTVRAVALNALSRTNKISLEAILNHKEHFDEMDLFGKANFLQAALIVSPNEKWIKDIINNILSYSNQSAETITFSEELDSAYTRILSSQARTNCAILDSLVSAAKHKKYKELLNDIPFKIVRMVSASKGNKDHFKNTQENMFCSNALIEYSKLYEQEKPNMNLSVKFNNDDIGKGNLTSYKDKPLIFDKKINPGDIRKNANITILKKGDGRLFYTTRVSYTSQDKITDRINAGIDIRREFSIKKGGDWALLKDNSKIKRGDLVKVDIYLSLPSARQFVAVNDPVISGLEPVDRNLATSSINDAEMVKKLITKNSWYHQKSNWHSFGFNRWGFYHKELNHDNVQFYSDYLMAGNYHLSYIAQAIASGSFSAPPVHAQEMYNPDIYGKGLDFKLLIADE
ncbi:MAG: large extracellular alpha-helical protein [Rickettsiales bacterium]|nr:large extracellular alpha-helical protein [Rickettsiales bacterium]